MLYLTSVGDIFLERKSVGFHWPSIFCYNTASTAMEEASNAKYNSLPETIKHNSTSWDNTDLILRNVAMAESERTMLQYLIFKKRKNPSKVSLSVGSWAEMDVKKLLSTKIDATYLMLSVARNCEIYSLLDGEVEIPAELIRWPKKITPDFRKIIFTRLITTPNLSKRSKTKCHCCICSSMEVLVIITSM